MKRISAFAIIVFATAARAQEPITLPEIWVQPPVLSHGYQKQNQTGGAGVGSNDKPDDPKSLNRLNEQLKRKVDEVNPVANIPPLDARSLDTKRALARTKIGVVNIPGVQQQYGQNFGKSVVPYRPVQPVFTLPSAPHH
jgi:hypothetical protein